MIYLCISLYIYIWVCEFCIRLYRHFVTQHKISGNTLSWTNDSPHYKRYCRSNDDDGDGGNDDDGDGDDDVDI